MRLKNSLPPAGAATSSLAKRAAARPTVSGSEAPQPENGARRLRHKPETRLQMLERLTNPLISLHEAGVLLEVCSATVRHYSDNGTLRHERTEGGQRRFYLRDVLNFRRERENRRREARSRSRRSTSAPVATEYGKTLPPRPMMTPALGATARPERPTAATARPATHPAAEGERPSSLVLRAGLRNARRS